VHRGLGRAQLGDVRDESFECLQRTVAAEHTVAQFANPAQRAGRGDNAVGQGETLAAGDARLDFVPNAKPIIGMDDVGIVAAMLIEIGGGVTSELRVPSLKSSAVQFSSFRQR